MIDCDLLNRLYKSYGFEISADDLEHVSVFLYKKSRYYGVDVILHNTLPETEESARVVIDSYSRSGFAVQVRTIKSNSEAELELFKSFFEFDLTKSRLKKKYNDFVKRQTKSLLGYPYQYIESPFSVHKADADGGRIFEIIDTLLSSSHSELIIIEAAAGYGKTCTAYEVLNRITIGSDQQLPIFTELARNRGASIFRYVLLDEIDLEFPSLNSELVIKEIVNGRIPVIIDGFDELLEKAASEPKQDSSFQEVETMLDTIGKLLTFKAKVILTTRKTAIFTGLEFETWVSKWDNKFNVARISIKEPRLKDWLGADRYRLIKEREVPIQYVANPVLLAFIKNVAVDTFASLIENPDTLIQQYFVRLLEREMERQNLIMTVESQIRVFKNVTRCLLELDSNGEEKEFFKMIILEENKKLLEETNKLYSGTKQTVDGLVDTLSNHALLDRRGRDQSQIGFINDFVFGTFIGQVIADSPDLLPEKYSNYMIDIAVTAFRVQNTASKYRLWEKIQPQARRFEETSLFTYDVFLIQSLVRNYSELSIYNMTFYNVTFIDYVISASVFVDCQFRNCTFDTSALQSVSFITCSFINCKLLRNNYLDVGNEVTAIKCFEEGSNILVENTNKYESSSETILSELEIDILRNIWQLPKDKGEHIIRLTQQFGRGTEKRVYRALKSLEESHYVEITGHHVHFNINRISVIKEILNA